MKLSNTPFAGLQIIHFNRFKDDRGTFIKFFHKPELESLGLDHQWREGFYSTNGLNVLRGMHFQTPPNEHTKLVFASEGSILDVVVDLRKAESTFGKYYALCLDESSGCGLIIPPGFAHGFLSLKERSTLMYLTTQEYSEADDKGIRYDSFGFSWPDAQFIISKRDQNFPTLEDFTSPF